MPGHGLQHGRPPQRRPPAAAQTRCSSPQRRLRQRGFLCLARGPCQACPCNAGVRPRRAARPCRATPGVPRSPGCRMHALTLPVRRRGHPRAHPCRPCQRVFNAWPARLAWVRRRRRLKPRGPAGIWRGSGLRRHASLHGLQPAPCATPLQALRRRAIPSTLPRPLCTTKPAPPAARARSVSAACLRCVVCCNARWPTAHRFPGTRPEPVCSLRPLP